MPKIHNKQLNFFVNKIIIPGIIGICAVIIFFYATNFTLTTYQTWNTTCLEYQNSVKWYVNKDLNIKSKDLFHVLNSCMDTLCKMGIDTSELGQIKIIFAANDKDYQWKVFFCNEAELGKSFTNNTLVLRPSDFAGNKLINRIKDSTYTYQLDLVISHELVHCITKDKLGFFRFIYHNIRNPWKNEGIAEHIAGRSSLKTEDGFKEFFAINDKNSLIQTDKRLSVQYFYFLSRLKTDYLLSKGISWNEFFKNNYDEQELEEKIKQELKDSTYTYPTRKPIRF